MKKDHLLLCRIVINRLSCKIIQILFSRKDENLVLDQKYFCQCFKSPYLRIEPIKMHFLDLLTVNFLLASFVLSFSSKCFIFWSIFVLFPFFFIFINLFVWKPTRHLIPIMSFWDIKIDTFIRMRYSCRLLWQKWQKRWCFEWQKRNVNANVRMQLFVPLACPCRVTTKLKAQ